MSALRWKELLKRPVPLWGLLMVIATAVLWGYGGAHMASPRTVEGWALSRNGEDIGFFDSPTADEGEAYVIAGADWFSADGTMHGPGQTPSCLGAGPGKAHIELGLVDVYGGDFGEGPRVVFVRCLD